MILTAANARNLRPDIQGNGTPNGEINRQYMDSSKAKRVLGWSTAIPVDVGLRRTVDWFRSWSPRPSHQLQPRTEVPI
jgi:nucleoside-diphosphate-sugar epimerase